jgi:hypothetical protein
MKKFAQLSFLRDAPKLDNLKSNNPMLKWGPGPAGRKCKECIHIVAHHPRAKRYLKCRKRGITSGAGTDHRANWHCCAYFEARDGN